MAKTGDDWHQPPPATGDDVVTTGLIAGIRALTGKVGELVTLAAELVTTIKSDRRLRYVIVVALGVDLAVLVGAATFGVVSVHRQTEATNKVTAVARQLSECTTANPGTLENPAKPVDDADKVHECFNDAASRGAAAIGAVIDTNHNGVADTVEILAGQAALIANQNASAATRGVELPNKTLPTPTTSTIPPASPPKG